MFRGLIDKRHNARISTDKLHMCEGHGKSKIFKGIGIILFYTKRDKELIRVDITAPVKIHYERSC